MSFYSIRYEYSDDTSNSQQSANADPPLFSSQQEFQQILESCNDPAMSAFPAAFLEVEEEQAAAAIGPQIHHHHQHPYSPAQFEQQFGGSSGYWQPQHEDQQHMMHHHQHLQHDPLMQHHGFQQQQQLRQHSVVSPAASGFKPFDVSPFDGNLHQLHDHELGFYGENKPALPKEKSPLKRMPFQRLRSLENAATATIEENQQFHHFPLRRCKMEFDDGTFGESSHKAFGTPAHWKHEFEEPLPAQQEHAAFRSAQHPSKGGRRQSQQQQQWEEEQLWERQQIVIVGGEGNDAMGGGIGEEMAADETMDELNDTDAEQGKAPQIAPNGYRKPAYSYSCLIGLSLKNSADGELTVHHFPYFREAPSGWKNSVRHNLSLNKCFKKIEVETPGSHGRKSCLWTMNPARRAKMDQELKKWREREEPKIRDAMEYPHTLDALQNGTMGMPPGMKTRRFCVPVSREQQIARQPQGRRMTADFSASSPATIGQDRVVEEQIDKLQKLSDKRAESVHAQAARKLENLLQRQKSSASASPADSIEPFVSGLLLPLADSNKTAGTGRKRRSADESLTSESSSSSTRRPGRHSNEHPNSTNTSIVRQPFTITQRSGPATMESERQKQEMAASYLSQQINKTVAERCPKREPYDVYLKRQQVQQRSTLHQLGPNSHRPLHAAHHHQNLAITIDPQQHPFGPINPHHQSPYSAQLSAATVGFLDSCENALAHNPLECSSSQQSQNSQPPN